MPPGLTDERAAEFRQRAAKQGATEAQINAFLRQQGSVMAGGKPEIPEFLAGPAFAVQAANQARSMAARAGNLLMPGQPFSVPGPDPVLQEAFPAASTAGAIAPTLFGGPQRLAYQVPFSAALGAISSDDPVSGALLGVGGAVTGNMAGRVVGKAARAGARGVMQAGRRITLPSGIRTTVGNLTGNARLQQVEQFLMRNPITARPFLAMREANTQLLRQKAIKFLGVQADTLADALQKTWRKAVRRIEQAVPDNAQVDLTDDLKAKFTAIGKGGEAIEWPVQTRTITGREFKTLRSDLVRSMGSASPTVRAKAREAVDLLDEAAKASPDINSALYASGRDSYRRWKTLTRGRAIDAADLESINERTLLNNIRKQYGDAVMFGGKKTGDDAADDLLQTVRDALTVPDPGANSITSTGLAPIMVLGDVATTGGAGTVGAFLGSEAMQTGFGQGLVTGAAEGGKGGARAGSAAGRAAALELLDDDEEIESAAR